VNFDQPAIDIERLRRAQRSGSVTVARENQVSVQLTLPDGTPYAHAGTLDFTDISVDPTTGAVALRGIIPNPEHQLLPGMFVAVRLISGAVNHGFLVPQAALQRDANGPYVLVAGTDDKVIQKRVVTETLSGPDWVVTAGLADGDRMIASGTQNARPGTTVAVVPYQVPQELGQGAPGPRQAVGGTGASATASASVQGR